MARTNDAFWFFPAYVPAAERRARAVQALAKLLKKSKRAPQPIAASRTRTLTTTFWGQAWCDNLERYADFASRLPRGRSYARNGSLVDLCIDRGTVHAHVAGSELYVTTIRVAAMPAARWRTVVTRCTGRIGSLVGLLKGELSADVLAVLVDAKHGLFPEPREIDFECSCPDQASMCKHVAAVLYGVGMRLDAEPALFFTLRNVDQAELLTSAAAGTTPRVRPDGVRRIAANRLAEVFGVELDDARPVRTRPRSGAAPPAGRGASRGGVKRRASASRPQRLDIP